MPASYQLYPDEHFVIVSYSGVLTLKDIIEVRQQGMTDPDFDAAFNVIDDVSAVKSTDIDFDSLSSLSAKSIAKVGVKRAMVAQTDLQKGMANMYRVLSESHGHVFNVFDSVERAIEWVKKTED